jgi:hypothetical protein
MPAPVAEGAERGVDELPDDRLDDPAAVVGQRVEVRGGVGQQPGRDGDRQGPGDARAAQHRMHRPVPPVRPLPSLNGWIVSNWAWAIAPGPGPAGRPGARRRRGRRGRQRPAWGGGTKDAARCSASAVTSASTRVISRTASSASAWSAASTWTASVAMEAGTTASYGPRGRAAVVARRAGPARGRTGAAPGRPRTRPGRGPPGSSRRVTPLRSHRVV